MSKITKITLVTGREVLVLNPIMVIDQKITEARKASGWFKTIELLLVPEKAGEQKRITINPVYIVCMEYVDWDDYPFPPAPPEKER